MKHRTRKPFVVPRIKELASLANVTLMSGGKGGKKNGKGPKGGPTNNNGGHGHGHNS